jgi:hypothetical protein
VLRSVCERSEPQPLIPLLILYMRTSLSLCILRRERFQLLSVFSFPVFCSLSSVVPSLFKRGHGGTSPAPSDIHWPPSPVAYSHSCITDAALVSSFSK